MLKHLSLKFGIPALLIAIAAVPAWSQNCQTRDEIAPEVRSGIEAAAQKAFDEASRGDANALRADAIPSLQSNFGAIAGAVNDNKAALAGATPQLRTSFLLDTGPTPSADGQFYCGVFGARGLGANGAEFDIPEPARRQVRHRHPGHSWQQGSLRAHHYFSRHEWMEDSRVPRTFCFRRWT